MMRSSLFLFLGVAFTALFLSTIATGQPIGSIVGWGDNDEGQLDVPLPNTDFISASSGSHFSLGLKSNGSIVAWGDNYYGQLNVPEPNIGFVALSAYSSSPLALRSNGTIAAWGRNHVGQCDVPEPNSNFIAVDNGSAFSMGLKSDGSIVAWGNNTFGECEVPEPNSDFVAISGSSSVGVGLKSDGSIVIWGQNSHGIGDIPEPNSNFVAIAAGPTFCLGLKSDGSIAAWGENTVGQCDVPEPNSDFIAIGTGGNHSLGLKSNGSIVAWGINDHGQCDLPSPNANFVSVSSASSSCLGLKNSPIEIDDVPNDQGGFLQISWAAFDADAVGLPEPVVSYDVQLNELEEWSTLATVSEIQEESYQVLIPSDDIFTIGQPEPFSKYRVVAHSSNPSSFYYSSVDSGYSFDNIAPPIPNAFLIEDEGLRLVVCTDPEISDLGQVCFYRGTSSGFVPDESVQCSLELIFNEPYLVNLFYRVQFSDTHGNLSEFSEEVTLSDPSGLDVSAPLVFGMDQNFPNPFNPSTTIKFRLPESSFVSLKIFDASGRLVKDLIAGEVVESGHQEKVWNGTDARGRVVSAGVYFYQLNSGELNRTRRMVLLK